LGVTVTDVATGMPDTTVDRLNVPVVSTVPQVPGVDTPLTSVTVPNVRLDLGTWMDTPVASMTKPVRTPTAVALSPTQTLANVGVATFFWTNDVAGVTFTVCTGDVAPRGVNVKSPVPPAVRQASGGAKRTLMDWLAVARRLPDSDHKKAVPCP